MVEVHSIHWERTAPDKPHQALTGISRLLPAYTRELHQQPTGLERGNGESMFTKDFEMDGGILLASLVLSDADVFCFVTLIHLLDDELRPIVVKTVFVFIILLLYRLSVPAGTKHTSCVGGRSNQKLFGLGWLLMLELHY